MNHDVIITCAVTGDDSKVTKSPHCAVTPEQIAASYGAVFESIEQLEPADVPLPGRGVVDFPLYLGHDLKRWP